MAATPTPNSKSSTKLRMKLAIACWKLGNWIRPPHTHGQTWSGDGSQKEAKDE